MKKLLLILLCLPMIGFGQDNIAAEDYFNIAKINNSNVEYQLAIDNYTRAIKIDPDYSTAYYNRGNTYKELENYKNAIADYTRAIKIDPDFANAYDGRGTAMWYLKVEYCSDYIRACNLGVCSNYNKFCK